MKNTTTNTTDLRSRLADLFATIQPIDAWAAGDLKLALKCLDTDAAMGDAFYAGVIEKAEETVTYFESRGWL